MAGWSWPNGYPSPPDSYGMVCTSEFGPRESPDGIGSTDHKGIDLIGLGGSNRAAADGLVIWAGYNGGEGNSVHIRHPGGTITKYFHHASLYVSAGQQVTRGQALGVTGTTGASTGVHCHFETWLTSETGAMNPRIFMAARIAESNTTTPAGGVGGTATSPNGEDLMGSIVKHTGYQAWFVFDTGFVKYMTPEQAAVLATTSRIVPMDVGTDDFQRLIWNYGLEEYSLNEILALKDQQYPAPNFRWASALVGAAAVINDAAATLIASKIKVPVPDLSVLEKAILGLDTQSDTYQTELRALLNRPLTVTVTPK